MPPPLDPRSIIADRQRLEAVQQTGLLDTPPEESFDRLTRLAAKLIGVPTTFISLVDQGRDFYKSCFGFGEPLSTTRQLEGRTFCHHAIVSSAPLVIDDTMADAVFRKVPTVQSLGVRAYAGIPLITDDGQAIGSF
jgi:GAF domain-containing protein